MWYVGQGNTGPSLIAKRRPSQFEIGLWRNGLMAQKNVSPMGVLDQLVVLAARRNTLVPTST